MKFAKIKLSRCKNCIHYKKIGQLHFCTNTKYLKKYKIEGLGYIPLFCFKKKIHESHSRELKKNVNVKGEKNDKKNM